MWPRSLLADLSKVQNDPTMIYFDNNSAIPLSRKNVFQKKRNHNDTCFHFICELTNDGDILIDFCGLKDKLADIFTRNLGKNVFEFQRGKLCIICGSTCNS